jgi:hypothetical protein
MMYLMTQPRRYAKPFFGKIPMTKRQDLTGQIFGTIKVLGFAGKGKFRGGYWHCICIYCETKYIKRTMNIRTAIKGCMSCSRKKHSGCHTRLFKIWSSMIDRCRDKKRKNYGSRGIKVFEGWNNFEVLEIGLWLMGIKNI